MILYYSYYLYRRLLIPFDAAGPVFGHSLQVLPSLHAMIASSISFVKPWFVTPIKQNKNEVFWCTMMVYRPFQNDQWLNQIYLTIFQIWIICFIHRASRFSKRYELISWNNWVGCYNIIWYLLIVLQRKIEVGVRNLSRL